MKRIKLLFVFVIGMMALQYYGQTIDSLNKFKSIESRLLEVETNTSILQSNLSKCHKQWVDGLGVCVFGVGASVIGGYMSINANYNGDKSNVGLIITGVGGLTSLIGTIVMLDSHKYIGKSGLGLSKGGITYTFK